MKQTDEVPCVLEAYRPSIGPRRRAFTLIECMVVLVTIAVVVAMVLPSLASAKARVRRVVCQGNLKQWGLAVQLYAADHNDYLAPEGFPNGISRSSAWYVTLPQTLGIPEYHAEAWRTNAEVILPSSIWICPSNTNRSNGYNLFHYCMNGQVDGTGAQDRARRLSSIPRPGQVVLFFDNGKRAAVAKQNNVHPHIHGEGANFNFLDGHVAWFRKSAYWDTNTHKGRTDNPNLVWKP